MRRISSVLHDNLPDDTTSHQERSSPPFMSIAHELSSDVAAAVLAAEEGEPPRDAYERAEVVREVHSTLRRLSADYRRRGRGARGVPDGPPLGEGAASGQH